MLAWSIKWTNCFVKKKRKEFPFSCLDGSPYVFLLMICLLTCFWFLYKTDVLIWNISGMWLCDDENEELDTAGVIGVDLGEGAKPPGYYVRRPSGLFPAPLPQDSPDCDRAIQHFWFLGVFLAKVLQDNRLVDLPLSQPFLKLMCHGDIQNNINERYFILTQNWIF